MTTKIFWSDRILLKCSWETLFGYLSPKHNIIKYLMVPVNLISVKNELSFVYL